MTDGQATTAVRSGHDVDIVSLERYFQGHIPGYQGPLSITQFEHGQSNPTFLLTTPGKKYVMRKQPPGRIVSKTAHRVDREFQVMQCLQGKVPVPQVLCMCHDTTVIGTMFYVMEFVQGRIFKDMFMPTESEAERQKLWSAAVDTLAALHSVDINEAGLASFGRRGGYFQRQVKTLSKVSQAQLQVSTSVRAIPEFERMASVLQKSEPEDRAAVVHGDYKVDNLVFHPTEPRVIAILDWEMATIGHPLADLGNLMAYFHFPAPMVASPKPADLDELFFVDAYGRAVGRPVTPREFAYALGFFFWKNTVILQGIAARSSVGQASNARAAAIISFMPFAAQVAMEALQPLEGESSVRGQAKL